MSINYLHIVPRNDDLDHDVSFFSECLCDPHFKPVEGGFLMVHRDAASRAMGLHALYHDANPQTWWVWREVPESPVRGFTKQGQWESMAHSWRLSIN